LELAGFYLPASECSGDWWNYRAHQDVTYLFISDVTGHGLPSALLTSAVNSCCSAIDNQIKNTGQFVKPSEILKVINDVIYQSSANLMLTMCIVKIDHLAKSIVFSNASHEFPLLIQSDGQMKTLLVDTGFRLGEKANSEYVDAEMNYRPQDMLFLYTDGLVENPNSYGKSWGDRSLLRFLKKNHSSSQQSRNDLKEAYFKFIENGEGKDDVTFFFAKLL
jgi:sigma-B regulation protein RsbU (phosphoserine phosphatase)